MKNPEEYIADLEFIPGCDECWGAQAYCEEHADMMEDEL